MTGGGASEKRKSMWKYNCKLLRLIRQMPLSSKPQPHYRSCSHSSLNVERLKNNLSSMKVSLKMPKAIHVHSTTEYPFLPLSIYPTLQWFWGTDMSTPHMPDHLSFYCNLSWTRRCGLSCCSSCSLRLISFFTDWLSLSDWFHFSCSSIIQVLYGVLLGSWPEAGFSP